MTGLLLGILLSRTVSGVVGELFGWRVMYQAAAVSIALIGLLLWRVLPHFTAHSETAISSADGLDGASMASLSYAASRGNGAGLSLYRL
ncbi:putative arabinose transporter [Kluyvera cryocrescens]|uniref:Putative arabinose transporter n=1 Tax=Kluyvera cryocrescens TaxID=580 RepID=A0A485CBB8_KLUCR|nr:putative arabinose transporter [Kluyvera cryocrescens]